MTELFFFFFLNMCNFIKMEREYDGTFWFGAGDTNQQGWLVDREKMHAILVFHQIRQHG